MPYNLLILPLCGGYFILLNFVYFKYRYQRLSSQRILFNSIIAGVFLICFTFVVRFAVEGLYPDLISVLYNNLSNTFNISIEHFWSAVASFFIAVILTGFLNTVIGIFFGVKKPIGYAVRKYGDEIEKLFRHSAKTGQLMQLSLKSNKVYIGFANNIPVPKETNYLKIIPVMSGYRDANSKILHITTEYLEVIDDYISDQPKFDISNMEISIKQDEILTAGIFNEQLFALFNKKD